MARHSLNELRVAGFVAQGLPQFSDTPFQQRVGNMPITPDSAIKIVLRQQFTFIPHEKRQEVEAFPSHPDLFAVVQEAASTKINPETSRHGQHHFGRKRGFQDSTAIPPGLQSNRFNISDRWRAYPERDGSNARTPSLTSWTDQDLHRRIATMIELLISACLASSPVCRDFSLLFDSREVSLMTCMISGQAVIAPWQQNYPDWKVKRWTCRPADNREVSL